MNKPKISVCIVTYNQADKIRQAIQSVLDQEVACEIEIIVSDDCSTDETRTVLKEIIASNRDIVRLNLLSTNVGPFKNYRLAHQLARGDYVAHLDGDDVFLPGKLAKQAQYLDEHPECPMVAHKMTVYEEGTPVMPPNCRHETISLSVLLKEHPLFLNSSIMYRRESIGTVFDLDKDFIDFYVYVDAAKKGDIGYLAESLGAYNANIGISSRMNLLPHVEDSINSAVGHVASGVLEQSFRRQYMRYARAALRRNDLAEYQELMTRAKHSCRHFPIHRIAIGILMNWPSIAKANAGVRKFARNTIGRVGRQ
jgi:glycosyltransferase involved in cell wall biosynthesis